MADELRPTPRDRFTFSLRAATVHEPAHAGANSAGAAADPKGGSDQVGPAELVDPTEAVEVLGSVGGVSGITMVDSDLRRPRAFAGDVASGRHADTPSGSSVSTGNGQIDPGAPLAGLAAALKRSKQKITSFGVDLESEPVFRHGSFTSDDPEVRAFSLQRSMQAMDLGEQLGAKLFRFMIGHDGAVTPVAIKPLKHEKQLRNAMNFLCRYNLDRGYGLRLLLPVSGPFGREGAPRRPIPMFDGIGGVRSFRATLRHPDQVGLAITSSVFQSGAVNGRSVLPALVSAIDAGIVDHIDLSGIGLIGHGDGSGDATGLLAAFGVVHALESSKWAGDRHLGSAMWHALDRNGAIDHARSSMRMYLMLRSRVKAWEADAETKKLRRQIERHSPDLERICASFSKSKAETLLAMRFEHDELESRTAPHERLRQRTLEILMGYS